MASKLKAALSKVAKYKEEAKIAVTTVVRTAEVGVTAGALGYLDARWPTKVKDENGVETKKDGMYFFGVPVSLLVAVGGHGAGFALGMSKTSQETAFHLHNVAAGAVAAYTYKWGFKTGIGGREGASYTVRRVGKGKTESVMQGLPHRRAAYNPYTHRNRAYAYR